jgi:hypothetical protein
MHTARRTYVSTTTSTLPCVAATSPPSVVALLPLRRAPRLLASVRRGSTSTMLCVASTRLPASMALLQLRRASECLDFSRCSSLITSPMLRLVVRLVVDYFANAVRSGASACRAARCRLLHLRRATGFLGTSRGLTHGSSSTTSRTQRVQVPRHIARLVVDYFAYAT